HPIRVSTFTLYGILSPRLLHSMQYFYTASRGLSTFPEFVAVGMVDKVQIGYYDSNIQSIVLKQAWIDQFHSDHPGELERYTRMCVILSVQNPNIKSIFFYHSVHIFQRLFGCEWDDEDGTADGNEQYGYDGEDFISFDLETLTWVAAVPQAVPTKQRWDGSRNWNEQKKYFLTKEFVDLLKELLVYGKSTLQRTGRRSPSSPVVCHATGFYPDRVVVFWRRDGQELHEQVDPGEVLPNHDGTFQVSVDLNLTAVPQEDWGSGPTVPIIIGFLVLLLAAAAAVVGVLLYKKRNGEWIKLSRRTDTGAVFQYPYYPNLLA
uniref:Immunoglobulin C1-set domain-containing protein n=1 Tax=Gadus morhua TaxID=8049 RepID=A0A8C5ALA7_GADMO